MDRSPLPLEQLQAAFTETYPRFTDNEAYVEASRCLYCFDAPCIKACPTDIDVPTFIRKIATGNVLGAARTILESNLMGHTCGRVCPVDELCVGACVLGAEHRPIAIGRLQRYATDHLFEAGAMPFEPAPPTGRRAAVVGSGPAGLSCAGELAKLGVEAHVFEKSEFPGGLSTYGIVVMREPVAVSLEEVEFVKRLGVPGEDLRGVVDALDFIAATKMAEKDGLERLYEVPVGREVIVVGAGNTAVDAATIARRLGAERVTMVYRRGREEMPAYDHEVAFVRNEGVDIRLLTQPVEVLGEGGRVVGVRCVRMALGEPDEGGRRRPEPVPGSDFVLPADQVILAIGQEKHLALLEAFGVEVERGYVKTDAEKRTSNPKVFAAGDCARLHGHALTVTAAQDGKLAALAIARQLGVEVPAPARGVPTGRPILTQPPAPAAVGGASG